MSVGSFHCAVTTRDGALWTWGSDEAGQCGLPARSKASKKSTKRSSRCVFVTLVHLMWVSTFRALLCALFHTHTHLVAFDSQTPGRSNVSGGHLHFLFLFFYLPALLRIASHTSNCPSMAFLLPMNSSSTKAIDGCYWQPVQVKSLSHVQCVGVACGDKHTLVLTEPQGVVFVMGHGDGGRLGLGASLAGDAMAATGFESDGSYDSDDDSPAEDDARGTLPIRCFYFLFSSTELVGNVDTQCCGWFSGPPPWWARLLLC